MTKPTPTPATEQEVADFIASIGGLQTWKGNCPPYRNQLSVSEIHEEGVYQGQAMTNYVIISGLPRAYFMANLKLRGRADWQDYHFNNRVALAGPDFEASRQAAKKFYESFIYVQSDDPEYLFVDVQIGAYTNPRYVGRR